MNQTTFNRISSLFLLGIARSGTTLLQSLLDGHPQLLVDVADSHFYHWYKRYYRWLDRLQHGWDPFEKRVDFAEAAMISYLFNELSPYYRKFLSHISINEMKRCFRTFLHFSVGQPKDFLESYFHALGLASANLTPQTRYWVDKTLSYEYLFYRYLQWWPEARFIYMIRDPRDVYTSYKKRDIRNHRKITSIESFALVWGDSAHALLASQSILPAHRCRILHYEDLVQDPQNNMKQIAHFLDIDFHSILLTPTKGSGRVPWGGNAESGKKQFGVFQDATHKWKSSLSAQEITCLEGLLHKEMMALGYELSGPIKPNPILSLKLAARSAFFDILNLGL